MTKDEARKQTKKIFNKYPLDYVMRSCWNCNGAHEHLKKCEVPLNCFECGKWFFKGIDITE